MDFQESWGPGEVEADEVLAVKGTTQQPDPRGQGRDVHIRIAAEREPADLPARPPDAPPAMCSFYIRRSDIVVNGYMPGCKGCTALRMQKPPQGHFDTCKQWRAKRGGLGKRAWSRWHMASRRRQDRRQGPQWTRHRRLHGIRCQSRRRHPCQMPPPGHQARRQESTRAHRV